MDAKSKPGASLPILLGVGAAHFLAEHAGLAAASLNPIASPVWPATGIALAAVVLWGNRVAPVILASAFLANVLGAASVGAAAAIALGTTVEAWLMAALVRRRCGGAACFESSPATWQFLAICAFSGPVVSASAGTAAVILDGHGAWSGFAQIWATWWMANVAGAVLVAPVILLWLRPRAVDGRKGSAPTVAVLLLAAAIGAATLGPLVDRAGFGATLPFLSILPLIWTAYRGSPRDTATVALLLSAFAVWGVSAGGGPLYLGQANQTYLLLQSFIVSVTVPSLVLSAHMAEGRLTAEALRGRTAELEAVLATVPAAVWVTRDPQASRIEGNRYAAELLRLPRGDNHSLSATEDERPSAFRVYRDGREVPADQLPVQRAARGATIRNEVLELRFADGTVRWEVMNAAPILDGGGGAVGAAMDITPLKEAERRQAILIEELDHRAKNMLASIQAIVRLTLGRSPASDTVSGRLQALARAHDRWKKGWNGVPLAELVAEALAPFAGEDAPDRASLAGPPLVVNQATSERLSLVLFELATNASKHGALSVPSGAVHVAWEVDDRGRLVLAWRERGGPPTRPPEVTGGGTKLMGVIVGADNIRTEYPATGFRCTLALDAGTWEAQA